MRDLRKNRLIRSLLYPFSIIFRIIVGLRNAMFDKGWFSVSVFPVPVISVGNIIAGGSGKTPFTMLLIRMLSERYQKIAVISRGYGRKSKGLRIVSDGKGRVIQAEEGGDEPVMIARKYPDQIVIVSEKRAPAIREAIDTYGAELIILDDAFQHRWVYRNCDIVLIGNARSLLNEAFLPAGNLRESPVNLKRAHLIVHASDEGIRDQKMLQILDKIDNPTLFLCHFKFSGLSDSNGQSLAGIYEIKREKVFAFSAIANPERFLQTLQQTGFTVAGYRWFKDHYFYTPKDLERIQDDATKLDCRYLVTTEKDLVKIDSAFIPAANLYCVQINAELKKPEQFMVKLFEFIDKQN